MGRHVWYAGVARGPLSDEEIEAELRTGAISREALLCDENGRWVPINERFPDRDAGKVIETKTATGIEKAALVFVTLAFFPVMAFVFLLRSTHQFDHITISFRWLWSIASFSTISLLVLATWLWWRATVRMQPKAPEAAAGLRVLIVLLGAISAVVTSSLLHSAGYSSDLVAAQSAYRDYSIEHHPKGNSINISGSIGPGFADELASVLRTEDVGQIEINSRGGLILEALRSARIIEARNLTVVARGECDSACIIVLMAGQHREADYDMLLGFHAPSKIIGGAEDYEMRQERRAAKAYLVRRGVPARLVARAEKVGPEKLYYVPAFQLARVGALTGLLSGDTPIDSDEAAFLVSLAEHQQKNP